MDNGLNPVVAQETDLDSVLLVTIPLVSTAPPAVLGSSHDSSYIDVASNTLTVKDPAFPPANNGQYMTIMPTSPADEFETISVAPQAEPETRDRSMRSDQENPVRDCCAAVYAATCCCCIFMRCLPKPPIMQDRSCDYRNSGCHNCGTYCSLVGTTLSLACRCLASFICPPTYHLPAGIGLFGNTTLNQSQNDNCCECLGFGGSVTSTQTANGFSSSSQKNREAYCCCLSCSSSENQSSDGCCPSYGCSGDVSCNDNCCDEPIRLVTSCCSSVMDFAGTALQSLWCCGDSVGDCGNITGGAEWIGGACTTVFDCCRNNAGDVLGCVGGILESAV